MGGGEIALLNLVAAVDKERFEIVVLLFAEGPLAEKLRAAGVEVRVEAVDAAIGDTRKDSLGAGSMSKVLKGWGFTTRLKRVIREIKPALVHTNSLKSDILGGIAARRAGVPVVWHIRDRIVPEYLPGKVVWVFRRLCRWIPWHVVAISEAVMETLRLPERFTREGRQARIVYDGVVVRKDERRNTKDEIGATTGRGLPSGLWGGSARGRGSTFFCRRQREVRSKFLQARFVIIGAALFAENEYEQQLQRLTDELGLRAAVEFTGFRTDVADLIDTLDILVHASTIRGAVRAGGCRGGWRRGSQWWRRVAEGCRRLLWMGNRGCWCRWRTRRRWRRRLCGLRMMLNCGSGWGRRRGSGLRRSLRLSGRRGGVEAVWEHVLGKASA